MTKDLQNVYICDLGVAKLKSAVQDTTTTATVIGTYPYMAPELFGASKRGTAVDIYSLGCLYIELFGERKVWPGLHTAVEVMQKVCGSYNTAPTMPKTDDLPLLYAKLCNSCCQLNAKDRVNIDAVIEQLISIKFV